jgi:DNA topoisomerase-1
MNNLLIVESPAKAKTIEKYLGRNFTVLSSVGHIRKDTKVDINNNFTVTYEITPDHTKIVSALKKAAASAQTIWLATDEDREGESISWHLIEVLNLPKTTKRITFHEITKPALEAAIAHPRTIDMAMVHSQQARQTLDMLVGFDLSGAVRKKVPGAISAGRVQSPALRLIVEREREIAAFTSRFTFKISGNFAAPHQDPFPAALDHEFPTEESAETFLTSLIKANYTISDISTSPTTRTPPPPFATATLQIEASSKLGFSASTTMRAAQALYQSGAITYHRTDSLSLSATAISSIADFITATYGAKYLKTRNFKTKSASAQEAHEAIRPTHIANQSAGTNDYERRLYTLIRTRTLATQMSPAKLEKTVVKITTPATRHLFIAKGEQIIFDGFLKVYGQQKSTLLPPLTTGDPLKALDITARQSFTKPPARYTEGSLVKKLEELGIGRPSTYAGIITAIQTRGYVKKGASDGATRPITIIKLVGGHITHHTDQEKTGSDKGKLIPEPIGELVSDFLAKYFTQIVDYAFTANIEKDLDKIADQKLEKVKMLRDFYTPFAKIVAASDAAERFNSARHLGQDPATNKPIYAKIGKNGPFIQLGENEKTSGEKPRFAPFPANETPRSITLAQALTQLALPALPRDLGKAKDGAALIAASGPFGPYLKAGKYNIPLADHDPYTITLATATQLYRAKLDSIIADWGEIMIIKGAYGPYVKGPGRRNNAKIPENIDPTTLTKAKAEKLLAEKPKSKPRRPTRRPKTTKKSPQKPKK